MQNLQVAVIGLIGILLGIAAASFFKWIDRKERFKVMTFEKRLAVHQRAHYWNQRIYHELSSRDANKLRETVREAQEWWNDNCLLLDDESCKSMISVFNSTNRYAGGLEHPNLATGTERVWDTLDTNLEDIIRGIGAEHLGRVNNDGATPLQETHPKSTRSMLSRIMTIPAPDWVNRYLFRALFTVAVLVFVTITIFASTQVPLSYDYTQAMRASFIFNSLAALVGLIGMYWLAQNRLIALLATIAIELFISGMFFELISLIEKAH